MRQVRVEAPGVRDREKEYRDGVLERWAFMGGHGPEPVAVESGL